MDADKIVNALNEQKELIKGKMDEVDGKVEELSKKYTELEGKMTGSPSGVSLPGLEEEKQNFSFIRAAGAIQDMVLKGDRNAFDNWNAGFEKEVFDNTREKAQSIGVGSQGGFLVPTQISNELVDLLLAKTVAQEMGATVVRDLSGSPFEIPTQDSDVVAYIVGENSAITESEAGFGQKTMTPRSFAGLVKLSRKSAMLSNPSLETVIRERLAKKIALRMDLACLRGSGVGVEPLGIVNTPGINNVEIGTNGGAFTFDISNQMVEELENDNSDLINAGFVMHSKVKNRLKRERIAQFSGDTGGAYVILPMTDQILSDTLGWNWMNSNQLPTNLTKGSGTSLSEIIFADWASLWIGLWGGLELVASNQADTAFATNQIWIRAIQEADCVVTRPTDFCLVNDATTS